jgi:hypothetical protein
MARTAAILLVLLSLAACEKRGKKAPAPPPLAPPPAPKVQAPASVPQELAERIAREWPEIEKEGKLFLDALAEATKARDAGDRAGMSPSVKAAQDHFDKAANAWSEIVYYIEDLKPQATADACRKYIAAKDKQVQGWMEKAKALAQFSTAK